MFPVSMYLFAAIPKSLHGAGTTVLYKFGSAVLFVFVLVFWLTVSNTGAAYMPYKNFLNIYPSERELCC
jgi:hypothetical protein